jgi:hypothetical protein
MSTYSILRNANVETVEKQGNVKTDKILSTLLWKSACSDTHYTYIIPSHHTKYKQKWSICPYFVYLLLRLIY